jgi:hypothetical protein
MYKKPIDVVSYMPAIDVKPTADVCVDQSYSKDFSTNEFGHPRSDVTALMQAQTEELYKLYASRLNELPVDQADTSSMSDCQIVDSIVPRSCQSPTQIASFQAILANKAREAGKREAAVSVPPLETKSDKDIVDAV